MQPLIIWKMEVLNTKGTIKQEKLEKYYAKRISFKFKVKYNAT